MLRVLSLVALLSCALGLPAIASDERPALVLTEEGVALHGRGEASAREHAWGIVAPAAVAITSDQRLFVSTGAGRIYDVTRGGDQSVARSWVTNGGDLRGLWVDGSGRLLVADARAGVVADASRGGAFASLPVVASGLGAPSALFGTRDGRLLVREAASGRVTDISAQRDATLHASAPVPELAASTRAWVAALLMSFGLITLRRFVDPGLAFSHDGS